MKDGQYVGKVYTYQGVNGIETAMQGRKDVQYHLAVQEENMVKGMVVFRASKRSSTAEKIIRSMTIARGKKQEELRAYLKKGKQSEEEWKSHQTNGPSYGHGLHILMETEPSLPKPKSEYVALNLHIFLEADQSRVRDVHTFLKTCCSTFTLYHTGQRFEGQVHMLKRVRPRTLADKCRRALQICGPCTAHASRSDLIYSGKVYGPWTESSFIEEDNAMLPWQKQIIESYEKGKTPFGNTASVTTLVTDSDFPIHDNFLNKMIREYNFAVHSGKTPEQIMNAFMTTHGEKNGYIFLMHYGLRYDDCTFLESVKRGCVVPAHGKGGEPKLMNPPYVLAMCERLPQIEMVKEWNVYHVHIHNHFHFTLQNITINQGK